MERAGTACSTETSDNMNQLTDEQVREWTPIVTGRVISLIGKATPEWEDVTQDIMLSMVKEIKIFRHDSDIKTLLYVVTMRRYYDYLRDKYRQKGVECYLGYRLASEKSHSPRRMRGPETRIDRINYYLNGYKLKKETRSLLEAAKKTIFSGRMN